MSTIDNDNPAYTMFAQVLGISPNLLSEGDKIAAEFDVKSKSGDKEFNLRMEAYCKKVWAPYFEHDGVKRWNIIDLTQAATEYFQVNRLPIPELAKVEIKEYLKGLNFPCDGIMYRWGYMQPFDYKFKAKTPFGIGIEVKVYESYYKKYTELGIPLWLLIWDNQGKRRLAHKVQNPKKYGEPTNYKGKLDDWFYDITEDCEEVQLKAFMMPPEPKNGMEEIALHLNSQKSNWKGGELKLTAEDEVMILQFLRTNTLSGAYNRLRNRKLLSSKQSSAEMLKPKPKSQRKRKSASTR